MPVWTIQGETGKAWDNTTQTLEFRAIEAAQLSFRSLEPDELSLGIIPEDFTTYTAPELGQTVKLYRNGSLFFTGTVTDVQTSVTANAQGLSVTVSGPWWWMERVNYTSTQTDGTGATATRMTGVFGDAANGTNLQTAIQTAINNIAALGVPIANIAGGSSVAAFFTVPRVTLNQGTCAFVITELCRMVPDVMVYFDYSTATPTLQVTRRGVATTRTLTLGTDEVDTLNIKPVYEMKVDQVALPYIERDVLGRTKFNQQQSGTASTGRVQIITVSGPELDTFLPNDLFEVVPVQNNISGFNRMIYDRADEFIKARELGMTLNQVDYDGGSVTLYQQFNGFNLNVPFVTTTQAPAITNEKEKSYTIAEIEARDIITGASIPSWVIEDYNLEKINIRGQWYCIHTTQLWYNNVGWGDYNPDPAPWLESLGGSIVAQGYGTSSVGKATYDLYQGNYTLEAYLLPAIVGRSGNSQSGGTNNTIKLATTASATDGYYVGKIIKFTRSSVLHTALITAYNGTTKVATLGTTFGFSIGSALPYTIHYIYYDAQTGTATGGSATTITLGGFSEAVDDFYVNRTVTWTKSATSSFSDTITDYNGSTKVATLSQSWSAAQQPANGNAYALDGYPLYKPADYSFIAPPANLAANLLAAQDFIPYEGEISLTQETVGAVRYRGCKINVDNSLTPHASMGALVSAETLDLKQGTTQITLGTPPRVDYRTFVDRIRKTPQDNIVFS